MAAIRDYVIDAGLRPGDPLPAEGEIARQLGVSRNSVREAVKALASLGVLESRTGSGVFVRAFSFEPLLDGLQFALMDDLGKLADLLRVRHALELGMLDEAAPNLGPARLAELGALVERMRQAAELGEAFPNEDRAFHKALFADVGNAVFLKLLDVIWLTIGRAFERAQVAGADPRKSYSEHRTLLEALQAGDAAAARHALDDHYRQVQSRLTGRGRSSPNARATAAGGSAVGT